MKPKEYWISYSPVGKTMNNRHDTFMAVDFRPDNPPWTHVIEHSAYRDLLSKYNLAITALAGCVDDRHYGGVYPRHTEILKILSGD